MKKILAFLLASILSTGLVGCGEDKSGPGNDSAAPSDPAGSSQTGSPSGEENFIKNEEDFAQRIPNYSCEIQLKNADSETVTLRYKVHPDGIAFRTDMGGEAYMIHDFKNKKTYVLNESDKTALSMDAPDLQNSFAHPATYFMAWGDTGYSALQKGRSEKVDGRGATVYFYKLGTSEIRYYIDKEMGFCLAYEVINGGLAATRWEMKNFKAGGVTAGDITVPADYQVTELPSGN